MSETITSGANPRIKRLVRLRDRRHRDAEAVFVVEGMRLFERAVAAGLEPLEIYVEPGHPLADRAEVTIVDSPVLDKASYRQTSEGVIAIFAQRGCRLEDVYLSDPPLILVAESIEKPGNLGAMARVANAVEADALISIDGVVDRFNANVLRSSTGALFDTHICEASLDEAISFLRARNVDLIATSPDARTSLWDLDLTGPMALAVGSEDTGHSRRFLDEADRVARIPMSGTVDSLNASTSLAVAAYEALRQRSFGGR